ncbi:MAG: FtsQ-type POTRA domain-containing protein [Proteobacteria bacterium]|uniref:FtsQ-type POTRA domain-containing protein n=1 Tax=Candidatus Avisuccinivibrio stercorigallinarum TaxID=2840704 RepID=A0A9D9DAX4_9GAMM|nr:FtsQ-type POTRA domain-containing protein [Candidatus Avisuccinivibrio stercorigallinarum]
MAGRTQSRGRFAAGLIFCLAVISFVIFIDLKLKDLLFRDDLLPVRAVVVDGALKQLEPKEIADIAGRLCAGHNIAALDTRPLQRALLQLPWTARVLVRKRMPDTLVISVVEHVPAAYWNTSGLYDARMQQVFYPDLQRFSEPLVRLSAERDNLAPEVYNKAVHFMRALSAYNLQMTEVSLDNIRCFRIRLAGGTVLILGRDNERQVVQSRLQRFLKAQRAGSFNLNEAEYVDLRYDVGFAVKKRSQEQEQKQE